MNKTIRAIVLSHLWLRVYLSARSRERAAVALSEATFAVGKFKNLLDEMPSPNATTTGNSDDDITPLERCVWMPTIRQEDYWPRNLRAE